MIKLSPTTAIMLYLGVTLTLLLGVWLYNHYRFRRKKIVLVEQKHFVCEYCHFSYLDDIAKQITQCPQCHSYNGKRKT